MNIEPCASCRAVGKVTINREYVGFSASCDCYDGAPVHSGDSGPSVPWGMTADDAFAEWSDRNAGRQAEIDEDPDYCEECSRHRRSYVHRADGHVFVAKDRP